MLRKLRHQWLRTRRSPEVNLPNHLSVPELEQDGFVVIGQTLSERSTSQEYTDTPPSYQSLHPFGLHNVLRMGEGQSKSEYNHDGRQKSENSHRRSHGDNTIEVPAFGTVPVRPAPPPPDAAPVERKMSAVVLQMNPVYRDVPFRLAPLLEMRSQCSELDNLCSRLKDQLRTSPMDIQYDFVLEKSVARDSG